MLRIVKKSTLDNLYGQIKYWRNRSKFILEVPYMKIDGIGKVQIYCEDESQAEKIKDRLTTKSTKPKEESDE